MNARHRSLPVVILIGWLLVACGQPTCTPVPCAPVKETVIVPQTVVVTVVVTPTAPRPSPTTPTRTSTATATSTLNKDGGIPTSCVAWNTAGNFIGQKGKCVCGPVVRTNYATSTTGQPTYLDIGVVYPDPQRLSVIIWGEHRAAFPWSPEQHYRGLTICVTGNITLYRDVPQIEVTAPSQIRELP
ncbi:MAG: hypothetical protein NT169_03290 [Chloroflexi bacterium]|nr:hypothetical protein [Chloroflexota bacterium]